MELAIFKTHSDLPGKALKFFFKIVENVKIRC